VFLINWGEIVGRMDPIFMKYLKEEKNKFAYSVKKFIDILSEPPFYGANEAGIVRTSKKQTRYIRITDIDEFGRLTDELGATSEKIDNRYMLYHDDLVIARSGNTVGKSYLHDTSKVSDSCIFAGYLINFRINKQIALPYYIFYYLQLSSFECWKNATMRLAGQPNINAQEYKNMLVPVPPMSIQQQIVEIMDDAYEKKRQKEQAANELLNSINSYLLDELGIVMPLEEENTLKNRMFVAGSNSVLGGRFDPKKYTCKYQQLFSAIENSPYRKKYLRDIITLDISGNWGLDETETDSDLVTCLTIRATEFDNRFNLDLENNRTKHRKYKPDAYEKIAVSANDILIEKSGGSDDQPVGRVAFIESEMVKRNTLAFSNFIHKLVVDESVAYPRYVFEYLRLMHNIKATEVMQTQTNGIRNLIMREYFGQAIIMPDINIQKRIANKAAKIRAHAYELEIEAGTIIDTAKSQVEKILLEGNT